MTERPVSVDDSVQLEKLGFRQGFKRTIGTLDSFAASFGSANFLSVRLTFFLGILAGGPLAMWTSFLINGFVVCLSSAILAEICSALPISGSLYIWAAVAAGPRYGRFVGFIVAWWVATSWVTFTASTAEGIFLYFLSLIPVFDGNFPGGISYGNVRWRALIWIGSEGILGLSALTNYISPRRYSILFRGAIAMIILDFLLCVIWLPIGANRTYGLRTARGVFLTTYNGTGATPVWNWALSFLVTSSTLAGFDAAGHVAEETKNASVVAARSIFRSAVVVSVGAFLTIILFLFCTPDFETLFSLNAPQPFVQIYALSLGKAGAVVMTFVAAFALSATLNVTILAASRIVFAIARDGGLPLWRWVSVLTPDGRPLNAVTVVYAASAILLCSILPSAAAFTSLLSGGSLPLIAAYGLIALLRLTITPNGFRNTKFPLGRARMPLYAISVICNGFLFIVLASPFNFPVNAGNMNFGVVVFGAITIFGIITFWLTPDNKWLTHKRIEEMYKGADQTISGPPDLEPEKRDDPNQTPDGTKIDPELAIQGGSMRSRTKEL